MKRRAEKLNEPAWKQAHPPIRSRPLRVRGTPAAGPPFTFKIPAACGRRHMQAARQCVRIKCPRPFMQPPVEKVRKIKITILSRAMDGESPNDILRGVRPCQGETSSPCHEPSRLLRGIPIIVSQGRRGGAKFGDKPSSAPMPKKRNESGIFRKTTENCGKLSKALDLPRLTSRSKQSGLRNPVFKSWHKLKCPERGEKTYGVSRQAGRAFPTRVKFHSRIRNPSSVYVRPIKFAAIDFQKSF